MNIITNKKDHYYEQETPFNAFCLCPYIESGIVMANSMANNTIPKDLSLEQVLVWFQDETRIGQKGSLSRLWAKKGTRPRVIRQQQFMCQYIYGAGWIQGRSATPRLNEKKIH